MLFITGMQRNLALVYPKERNHLHLKTGKDQGYL